MKNKKKRYSWAERKAYYIGVGLVMASDHRHSVRRFGDSFVDNTTDKEYASYCAGTKAHEKNPDMFNKKKK